MSNNIFFELLQVALGNRDRLSEVPSEKQWMAILKETRRQAIISIMVEGVEHLPQEQMPSEDILLPWLGLMQKKEGRYVQHCERAAELTRVFEEAGFRSCVLKGVGTAQFYPNPAHRQGGDIDLWVDGPREDIMRFLKGRYKIKHVEWHHVGTEVFDDVKVEVHIFPGWMYRPLKNKRLLKWFEERKASQMTLDKGLGFAHSTAEFDAVFSLVHTFHHLIEEGVGLRHIVDYYYILKALSEESREETKKVLKSVGLGPFAAAMMWVLKEVCGMEEKYLLCTPNERGGRFLSDEVMRGGNFGQFRRDGRKRNTAARKWALLPYYPGEVLAALPWKVWHRFWRKKHRA